MSEDWWEKEDDEEDWEEDDEGEECPECGEYSLIDGYCENCGYDEWEEEEAEEEEEEEFTSSSKDSYEEEKISRRYEIVEKDGKKHLIEKGLFGDIDRGELHERLLEPGVYETRNIFGENFELRDKSSWLNKGQEFEVKTSGGEEGSLRKSWWGKHYNYEGKKVESGGGCYIVTACTKIRGLPNDCQELGTLRAFRDNFIKKLPWGKELIEEYYRISPSIVVKINGLQNSKEIWSKLYEEISECVGLVQSEKKVRAFLKTVAITWKASILARISIDDYLRLLRRLIKAYLGLT